MHMNPRDITLGVLGLPGQLSMARDTGALVIFAHGSGSSRLSPRNRQVADMLLRRGLATLLFDLLSPEEAGDRTNVFDIALLTGRMVEAIQWARADEQTKSLPIGLFGASTGAAAALSAAARLPEQVDAVVSRGGRPDLAWNDLPQVRAPTLFIVGENDPEVLSLNREASRRLGCEKRIIVIPRATHLFEEAGTLEEAATAACDWFTVHLLPSEAG